MKRKQGISHFQIIFKFQLKSKKAQNRSSFEMREMREERKEKCQLMRDFNENCEMRHLKPFSSSIITI